MQNILKALAEVERLQGEAKRALEVIANLRAVLGLCWKPQQNMPPAPEDEEVEFLCEVWGYGAVMASAARLWARRDPTGAHTVGPCICTVKVALGMAVEEPDLCPLCDQPKHKSHSPDCPKARGEGIEA